MACDSAMVLVCMFQQCQERNRCQVWVLLLPRLRLKLWLCLDMYMQLTTCVSVHLRVCLYALLQAWRGDESAGQHLPPDNTAAATHYMSKI